MQAPSLRTARRVASHSVSPALTPKQSLQPRDGGTSKRLPSASPQPRAARGAPQLSTAYRAEKRATSEPLPPPLPTPRSRAASPSDALPRAKPRTRAASNSHRADEGSARVNLMRSAASVALSQQRPRTAFGRVTRPSLPAHARCALNSLDLTLRGDYARVS